MKKEHRHCNLQVNIHFPINLIMIFFSLQFRWLIRHSWEKTFTVIVFSYLVAFRFQSWLVVENKNNNNSAFLPILHKKLLYITRINLFFYYFLSMRHFWSGFSDSSERAALCCHYQWSPFASLWSISTVASTLPHVSLLPPSFPDISSCGER